MPHWQFNLAHLQWIVLAVVQDPGPMVLAKRDCQLTSTQFCFGTQISWARLPSELSWAELSWVPPRNGHPWKKKSKAKKKKRRKSKVNIEWKLGFVFLPGGYNFLGCQNPPKEITTSEGIDRIQVDISGHVFRVVSVFFFVANFGLNQRLWIAVEDGNTCTAG